MEQTRHVGVAKSEHPRLTDSEIIFREFQPICDHNPPTLQTDRQTTCDRKTALCAKVHLAVKRIMNKKAQLSLTNPRSVKARQKLQTYIYSFITQNNRTHLHNCANSTCLQRLSLTILIYSFSCCCVRNLRNSEKFSENSNLEFKVI